MKMLLRTIALVSIFSMLASCSAEKRFHRRLVGTWDVDRYEQQFPSGEREVTNNLGTITFRRNGGGDNDLPVLTRGIRKPENSDFSWNNTTASVTIISRNSLLAKSWIVVRNKKSHQVWKSTTQANVQTMELRKR